MKDDDAEDKRIKELEALLFVEKAAHEGTKKLLADVSARNALLEAALAKRYAKASEAISKDQILLFDETELEAKNGALNDKELQQPSDGRQSESIARKTRKYVRAKSRNATLVLPADTPITVIRVPEGGAPVCGTCGATKVKVGERYVDSVVRTISYSIVRRIYTTYACPNCSETVPMAARTGNLLDGTICDPLFLADVINSKFNFGVPLYRYERLLRDAGYPISRQTLASWIMRAGWALLDNLEPMLEEELFRLPMINADETPMQALSLKDEDGNRKAPDSKFNSFMMARVGIDGEGRPNLASFRFTDNRRNETVRDFFAGYHGVLQSDGLSGYAFTERNLNMAHLLCLVHSRREAVNACGNRRSGIAYDMVQWYARIFHAESAWDRKRGTMPKEDFIAGRKAEMLPLFEEFRDWLVDAVREVDRKGGTVAPETAKAVSYYLDNYANLVRFLDYYFATSGNQTAEQFIRKFVIDRNNFLFCITEDGAEVSALFFSLVMSCRNLGVNPADYLCHLFLNAGNVRNGDKEDWRELLPGRGDVSDAVELRNRIAGAHPDPEKSGPYILRGKRL